MDFYFVLLSADMKSLLFLIWREIMSRDGIQDRSAAEKERALESALKQIEKQFGKGAIIRLGDNPQVVATDVISTGCLEIDVALGIKGLPRGRIVEIFGPESSGKTTVALHCIAAAQKLGGAAAFIDVEHALDPIYAKNLGVDTDNLFVSQPDTGEQALEISETLIRSGAIDIVVVDSVAALVPKSEIDGEMGDTYVGLQARLMSQALRKLAGAINKSNTIAVFINQLREKVGSYGNPEVTPGGRALKFYASVRLDVRKGETIKNGEEFVGNRVKVKVVKNKLAPPFKVAECELHYGKGISPSAGLINLGVQYDVVTKSGSWFSYKETRLGQGRDNSRQFLEENPEIANAIQQEILDIITVKPQEDKHEQKPPSEDFTISADTEE